MGFFTKKERPSVPTTPREYPSGVCVETESGRYFINGKFRHLIPTQRVFSSWSFPIVARSSDAALSKYPKAKPLGFRDGTIVRALSSGKLYIITKRERRAITNPDTLELLGVSPVDVLWVSDEELKLHEEGEVIN